MSGITITSSDFLQRPDCDRQLIFFVDDVAFDRIQELADTERKKENENKELSVIDQAIWWASWLFVPSLAYRASKEFLRIVGVDSRKDVKVVPPEYRGIAAIEKGAPLLPVPKRWYKDLGLPIGHPRIGVIYAAHPARQAYIPLSDVERTVINEMASDLFKYLASLGATSVRVHASQQVATSFDREGSVGVAKAGESIQAGEIQSVKLEGSFEGQSPRAAFTPIWPWDMDFLTKGCNSTELHRTLSHTTLGVDASVKGALKEFGFSVGNTSAIDSTWTVDAKFQPEELPRSEFHELNIDEKEHRQV